MKQSKIAKKYSLALFELAKEEDKLLGFKEELEDIVEATKKYNDLRKILFHPRVTPADKKKLVQDIFSFESSNEIINFLKLLIDKRREFYLEAIYEGFVDLLNQEKNILEVEVISAIKLSRNLKDKLEKKIVNLLGSQVVLQENINPDIIGGLVLKIGDRVIDGSIRHDLESLKSKIVQIPVSELGV